MIPEDPAKATKIAQLKELQAAGTAPRVAELVAVAWPLTGPIYYAIRVAAELLDNPDLLARLDGPIEAGRLGATVFLEIDQDAGISDETIDLDFWDADSEITRLILTEGAGARVEVFYYFPEVDLLLAEWWGHLQPPDQIAFERVRARAESGFRSSNLPMPARGFFTGCQAIFGGLLDTQAEIDEGDCPYNLHLGGALAGSDPVWTNIANGTAGAGGSFLKTGGGGPLPIPLTAAWKLTNLIDNLGGRTLTNFNAVTFGAGKIGTAAQFVAASSQYLKTPLNTGLNTGGSWCFSVWFKRGATGSLQAIATMSQASADNSNAWILYFDAANNLNVYYVRAGGGTNFLDATVITDSNWHHAIVWFDTVDNKVRLRLDHGTTVASAVVTPLAAITGNFFLGCHGWITPLRYWTGAIDAVGWGNFAPTTGQQDALWNSGAGLEVEAPPAWDCGASHGTPVAPGTDASMRFKFAAGYTAAGFFTTAAPLTGNADCHAVLQANPDQTVTCKYGGSLLRAKIATWSTTDNFEIQLRGGIFYCYQNGTEIMADFKVPLPPVADPLYLGVAIMNAGAGLSSAAVNVGTVGPAPAFGNVDPATGLPYTSCPRNTPQVCIDRLGDSKSYLAFDTVAESHLVHETKGPNITVTSRGNETNLKRPLRVIAGHRHVYDLDLLAFVVEPNTNHPDEGSVKCLFANCEGPVQAVNNGLINGLTIAPFHNNYRTGEKRQGQTSFSPNILNYSGTSLFLGVAQGDFTQAGAEDLRGEVDIDGLRDVRVYYTPTTFSEMFTADRAWWLLHCLRNKRWGYGADVARIMVQDWIDLAKWCAEIVGQRDQAGADTTGPRTQFNAELIDRTAQQQIFDICLAGRFGLPFGHRGFLRVLPLRRALELFAATVFTDKAFWGCLARAPTTAERTEWLAALATARAAGNVALLAECTDREAALFGSAEYTARARTDPEFVTDCYYAYLRRAPDPLGHAFWLDQLATIGRVGLLAAFATSTEFEIDCTDHPVATFSDRGEARNICVDDTEAGKTTLGFAMQTDADLCNRIVLTFDDQTQKNQQIPLTFEHEGQQLRAGRAFGDTSRRVVERSYNAFGVTSIGEAGRLGNLLLDLGEFDEGGVYNNLRATFVTWYLEAVDLHRYQLIKLESNKLDQINQARADQGLEPFAYFRIRSISRRSDLTVEISAQAYPATYYDQLELLNVGPFLPPTFPGGDGGFDPNDPIGPGRERLPYEVTLSGVGYTTDHLFFTIEKDPL